MNIGQTLSTVGDQLVKQTSKNVEIRVGSYSVVVKQRLAEGGFGFIDLAADVHSGKMYVLKRCSVERQQSRDVVKKEIKMLEVFKGNHVVELLASEMIQALGSPEAILLLSYCPGGHLLERLNSREGSYLPSKIAWKIFGQILLGVQPLHENLPPVAHRDLKLENILFDSEGIVRICDFGSCVMGHVPIRTVEEKNSAEEIIAKECTPAYRAPEMVDLYIRDILTEKTDIWALGCIFYAICFLCHPFQDTGSLAIINGKFTFPSTSSTDEDSKAMILRMLDVRC